MGLVDKYSQRMNREVKGKVVKFLLKHPNSLSYKMCKFCLAYISL